MTHIFKVGDRTKQIGCLDVEENPLVTITAIENNGESIRHIHDGSIYEFTCSPEHLMPLETNNWRKIIEGGNKKC